MDAAAYLQPTLANREFEIVVVLMLDTRNNVIKQLTLSEGTLDAAITQPRKLAKDVCCAPIAYKMRFFGFSAWNSSLHQHPALLADAEKIWVMRQD